MDTSLILLYHRHVNDVSGTLEQIFKSPIWIDIDMSNKDHIRHLDRLTSKSYSRTRIGKPINIYLRNVHYASKQLRFICDNSKMYMFNVVVHCSNTGSISPACVVNMDYILAY